MGLWLSLASVPISACALETDKKDRTAAGQAHVKQSPWWQSAVFYEIYPRSFADSNGDGVGDINGITSKLDYLRDLGVDALWITPCFPSPQVDFGYDVSDYRDIAPEFGTLADFDRLIAEARKRNIRIVLDYVVNHSSDQHEWFKASTSSKDNPKRDWYVWRDGKDGGPPNNWISIFGHSAWKFDPKTKQYYYHFFYPEQPDLNWRNPEVRKAMYDVLRFWIDRGVAGFRLDAVTTIFEDPKLRDNPVLPGKNKLGDPNMDNKYNHRLAENHEILKELRKVVGEYPSDPVLIGETFTNSVGDLWKMYGERNDEVQLPMNFFFTFIDKLSAPEFARRILEADRNPVNGWPVYLFSNHDTPRHYVRYGNGANNDQIAKLTATLLLTLRGTPILYYGEELGMENRDPRSKDEVQDPIGKLGWPAEKGRDGERTPMQWTPGSNAGFTTARKAWLPITDSFQTHNVETESKDPASVLNWYKKLLTLRRSHPALLSGEYVPVDSRNTNVLTYLRKTPTASILVAMNMSKQAQKVSVNVDKSETPGKVLASSYAVAEDFKLAQLELPPFGVLLTELK